MMTFGRNVRRRFGIGLEHVLLCLEACLIFVAIPNSVSAQESEDANVGGDLYEECILRDAKQRELERLFQSVRISTEDMYSAFRKLGGPSARVEAELDRKRLDVLARALAEKELQLCLLNVQFEALATTNSAPNADARELGHMREQRSALERDIRCVKQAVSSWTDRNILAAEYVETLLLPYRAEVEALKSEYARVTLEVQRLSSSIRRRVEPEGTKAEQKQVGPGRNESELR